LERSFLSEEIGKGSKRKYFAGVSIAILLFVYGVITIINFQLSIEHIGTYIYGNALTLFLFTGLPAIIIGLIILVMAYRRR
jgi:hypothetical protein